jgi:hypothetical protein
LVETAEEVRRKKEDMIKLNDNPLGVNKEMKVCDICGAL